MSDSEGDEVIVAEEVTPDTPVTGETLSTRSSSTSNTDMQRCTIDSQSSHSCETNGALPRARTGSEPNTNNSAASPASGRSAVSTLSRSVDSNGVGAHHASRAGSESRLCGDASVTEERRGANSNWESSSSNKPSAASNQTSSSGASFSSSQTVPSPSSSRDAPLSTSTPTAHRHSRDFYPDCDRIDEEAFGEEEEEEEDCTWEELRREARMGNVADTIFGYSPLVLENNEGQGDADALEELYVPISGFEVMEQRAKFTVFKLNVQKSPSDGYFIFRRYTDFTRLNNKLRILYPGFRLALPPKRWFGNNFDPMFLEDRMLGLQAFLNNITGHKDIRKSGPVREFLCINDPPGPHDSLEESRVMVESLEEVAYGLKRELVEKDRILRKKDEEIERLKARIQELENAGLPVENERVGTDQESESSTVEGDRRSCVEADLSDHCISDPNDNGLPESLENTLKVNVDIETLGKQPEKCGKVIGDGTTVTMAISQSAAPVVGDSR